jgi:hypothetical protein
MAGREGRKGENQTVSWSYFSNEMEPNKHLCISTQKIVIN